MSFEPINMNKKICIHKHEQMKLMCMYESSSRKVEALPKILRNNITKQESMEKPLLQSHSNDLKRLCQYNWFDNVQVESPWNHNDSAPDRSTMQDFTIRSQTNV